MKKIFGQMYLARMYTVNTSLPSRRCLYYGDFSRIETGLIKILYLKMRQLASDNIDKRNRCSVITTAAIYAVRPP